MATSKVKGQVARDGDDEKDVMRKMLCEQRDELVALYNQLAVAQGHIIYLQNTLKLTFGDLEAFRSELAQKLRSLAHRTSTAGGQHSPSGRYRWNDRKGFHETVEQDYDDD